VFGTDIDVESIQMARIANPEIPESNIEVMESEKINYSNNSFDIIFQNEVLEHVKDDILTLEECLRILDDRGKLILFTPNSGWPFETHGIFLNSKYYWGNIPLLPWLPKTIQKRFAPHVRNYTNGEVNSKIKKAIISLEKITPGYQYEVIYHRHVFPGFDKLGEKLGVLGNGFKNMFRFFEKTPLHFFGISHLIVIEKLKI